MTASRGHRPERYLYHGTTRNLVAVTSPRGIRTSYMAQDALGRDTLVTTPLDGSLRISTRTRYDAADRPVWVQTVAPPTDARHGTQTLTVETDYDPEGATRIVDRTITPDTNRIGRMRTQWVRDAAGRVIHEIASDGSSDTTVYDPAGQVIRYSPRPIGGVGTQTSGPLRMRYDALGRIVERIIPAMTYVTEAVATFQDSNPYPRYSLGQDTWIPGRLPGDTARFVYDITGGISAASNREATVWRSYHMDGSLRTDSTAMRSWEGPSLQHVFGISHTYDAHGRRRYLDYPQNVVGTGARVTYAYHPQTGALATLTALGGHAFRFGYNGDGQLTQLLSPAGIAESTGYTVDGQVAKRRITIDNAFVDSANGLGSTLRNDDFTYDHRGKILQVSGTPGSKTLSDYAPMGALAFTETSMPYSWETLTVDALGNKVTDEAYVTDEEGLRTRRITSHHYSANGTNRLLWTITLDQEGLRQRRDATEYDDAGNRIRYYSRTLIGTESDDAYNTMKEVALEEKTRSYYDRTGQLRAIDRRACITRTTSDGHVACVVWEPEPGRDPSVFEEYRYDALGRRIGVRSRFDATHCNAVHRDPCTDRLVRTVWDGDQLLLELRANDGSLDTTDEWVAYTQGPGIDAPLVLRAKLDRSSVQLDIIPLANWRGLYEVGVFPDGRTAVEGLDLKKISWPAANYSAYFDYIPNPTEPEPVWLGSLMSHKRDASGQLYMRNRYYDPKSGRFTQEDPIGLAGGLNLYGFGGGDPVNYSDPYGLCILPRRICNALAEAGDKAVPFWADRAASAESRSERLFATGMGLLASLCTSDTCDATDRVLRGDLVGGARDALEGLRGGVVGHSNSFGLQAEELTFSGTVASHTSSRPYMNSTIVTQAILDDGVVRPDPQGAADTYRWDLRGAYRGSLGTYELVVNVETKTIIHYNFVSDRK